MVARNKIEHETFIDEISFLARLFEDGTTKKLQTHTNDSS